jgi:adenylate cyclase
LAREFERRFLVKKMPTGKPVSETLIRQAYWRLGGGWSLRLRRLGDDPETENWIAVKGPRHGSERWEFEYRLDRPDMSSAEREDTVEAVLNLYRAGAEHVVVKRRKSFVLDGHAWDIDEFMWDNDGLVIAEIEAQNQTALLSLGEPPTWLGREVTLDARYNNENLAYDPLSAWSGEREF